MKQLIFYICFFVVALSGWNKAKEQMCLCEKSIQDTDLIETVTATNENSAIGQTLFMNMEANSCAHITEQTVNLYTSQLSRRYRPAGYVIDKQFVYLTQGQRFIANNIYKNFSVSAQEYMARQKIHGYFVYTLRRIII